VNYFVEGLQGSGKSTLVKRLAERLPDHKVFHEGDYSPVELACACMSAKPNTGRFLKNIMKYGA
jgi:thymidylate kinase